MAQLRWTSADLEVLPDDGKRYEIIDGELYVSRQPHYFHQRLSTRLGSALDRWSDETGAGETSLAPGLIFADDDDVVPDIAWVSSERLSGVLWPDGKLHGAPDLLVEILSPGATNEQRDREVKLKLYSRRGVREYWIVSWQRREVEIYRRRDAALELVATFLEGDALESPLLPGFAVSLKDLFAGFPSG
ncbi:MAG TPA: Uma2 family endonuclease [Candidatus Methylomirabilis sp.]